MAPVRDVAQDLFDRFAGFVRGHATSDRAHPGVGVAFIIAAIVVLLVGLRWFTDSGDSTDAAEAQNWALDVSSGRTGTTIGDSPEAVAVRVGTAVPHGVEEEESVTIGIPGTSIEIEIPLGPTTTVGNGPGTTGGGSTPGGTGSNPGGGTTTTRPRTTTTRPGGGTTTTTEEPPTTTTTTTEEPPTTTTTEEPPTTTTEVPPDPTAAALGIDVPEIVVPVVDTLEGDLLGEVVGSLGSLLG
jgi:hypothetical protein